MRFYLLLSLTLVASLLSSCGEPAASPSLQKARAIHAQLNELSVTLHDGMQESLAVVETQIEASLQAGDSALAIQLARLESQLGELDVRFHDWNATVVGIPGDACDHDHDHDHDHGDHEGHDHGDHDHAHGNELSLEGMTDAQILEIQEALLAELGALQALFDSIGSAVPEAVNE
jgi:hypothetical protein